MEQMDDLQKRYLKLYLRSISDHCVGINGDYQPVCHYEPAERNGACSQ